VQVDSSYTYEVEIQYVRFKEEVTLKYFIYKNQIVTINYYQK